MIVYGSKSNIDIACPFHFSHETGAYYEVEFSANVPDELKNVFICGLPFYRASYGGNVYLYSDWALDGH